MPQHILHLVVAAALDRVVRPEYRVNRLPSALEPSITNSRRRSPSSFSFSTLASTNSRLTLDLLTPRSRIPHSFWATEVDPIVKTDRGPRLRYSQSLREGR
jgi:hypothetical protein